MEQLPEKRSKGGRPKKAVPRDQLLGVKCTLIERKAIEGKARSAGLTVSEYLRELGLYTKIRGVRKTPKEALMLIGTISHTAANVNQIAHERNKGYVLNTLERAKVLHDVAEFKQYTQKIIQYYQ